MSSVETLGALERRLNASIPQQAIRGEVDARLKRIGRTAKVPGFRPGKVPHKMIEAQYGAQVYQEVVGEVLERNFAETADSMSLKVVGVPRFELKPNAEAAAESIEYSATFEVYPEITLGDISAETVERATYTPTDADLESTLTTLRRQRGVYEISREGAQKDDRVSIDFTGKLNGEVFQGGEAKGYIFVLGQGRMLPDFENAITGMKALETKSFDMTFPEDYHGKDVAGKQVTFTITVNSVETPRLPELDEAFARSLGIEDGDVAKLTSEVKANLEREVARRLKVMNKDAAMDALLRIGSTELPKTMLAWEVENLRNQAIQDMEARGAKMPQGMTLPAELFGERADKRVRLGLILAETVSKNGLEAKPEQIRALLEEYAQSFEEPEQVVRWYYTQPDRLQEVENLAVEDNVVAWVMSNAKVTDKVVTFDELMGKA